ncbi:MAG TPA: permease [Xanthobacteraceae bacterium]|nr:permease [Xanthobacteraceae bacterium]
MPASPPIERRRRKPFDWSLATIAAVVAIAAAYVYLRDGPTRSLAILSADFTLFLEMQPKVLAACLIAALVAALLPRETISRWVGAESGFVGLLIGAAAGVILPGGPITIFPVAAAFLAMGADAGVAIAFVTSWTLLGYTRALVWELPIFGLDFVIWRSIAALPLPILAGLLARFANQACARLTDDRD